MPGYYKKEQNGIKPNTVRIISKKEDSLIQASKITAIEIINVDTGEKFQRIISDITYFVYYDYHEIIIYIFSWQKRGCL